MLKVNIMTPERRHWRRFGVFIVNSEHISHLVLVFLLLTLSRIITCIIMVYQSTLSFDCKGNILI